MRIAIIGASPDKSRYSNKAVRAFLEHGDEVIPVNPNYDEVEGLRCYKSVLDISGKLDYASMYVRPDIGLDIADDIIKKKIPNVYLNPGAESSELEKKFRAAGVKAMNACSIVSIGYSPLDF